MRPLALVALAACGFQHGSISSDAKPEDARPADAGDASTPADASDAPRSGPYVRLIDIVDGRVSGGPHADFPLLVAISGTWLRAESSGGDVARADGFDIHFSSNQAGTILLSHEVEHYAPATGTLVAWVRLPSLEATSVVYLHYGDTTITTNPQNAIGVWSAGYEAVFHLDDVTDSTAKNTPPSSVTSGSVDGRIDIARTFDAIDDYVDIGAATAIANIFTDSGTAEAWFYATGWGENSYGRIFDKGHASGWSLWLNNVDAAASIAFLHGASSNAWGHWNTPAQTVTLNAWHHVALVYNKDSAANNPLIYLDGAPVTVNALVAPSGTMLSEAATSLRAGNRAALDRTFDGRLDELKLSSVARSADWILTEYRNQLDPSTFYAIGPEL